MMSYFNPAFEMEDITTKTPSKESTAGSSIGNSNGAHSSISDSNVSKPVASTSWDTRYYIAPQPGVMTGAKKKDVYPNCKTKETSFDGSQANKQDKLLLADTRQTTGTKTPTGIELQHSTINESARQTTSRCERCGGLYRNVTRNFLNSSNPSVPQSTFVREEKGDVVPVAGTTKDHNDGFAVLRIPESALTVPRAVNEQDLTQLNTVDEPLIRDSNNSCENFIRTLQRISNNKFVRIFYFFTIPVFICVICAGVFYWKYCSLSPTHSLLISAVGMMGTVTMFSLIITKTLESSTNRPTITCFARWFTIVLIIATKFLLLLECYIILKSQLKKSDLTDCSRKFYDYIYIINLIMCGILFIIGYPNVFVLTLSLVDLFDNEI
ncbi:hypothetical protein NPIL_100341 [Nephila pilipes]|uniref:Uncharacterized protein n=1 Tax=Nephila pilipes TaxID=299642 RepID=A0A8X6SZB5_NEPPI|nr:hypothetical protein NPIL_100341 [Nephila pilipes]